MLSRNTGDQYFSLMLEWYHKRGHILCLYYVWVGCRVRLKKVHRWSARSNFVPEHVSRSKIHLVPQLYFCRCRALVLKVGSMEHRQVFVTGLEITTHLH